MPETRGDSAVWTSGRARVSMIATIKRAPGSEARRCTLASCVSGTADRLVARHAAATLVGFEHADGVLEVSPRERGQPTAE